MRNLFFILLFTTQFINAQTFVKSISLNKIPNCQIPQDLTINGHAYFYQDSKPDFNNPFTIYNEICEPARVIDLSSLSPKIEYYNKTETKDKNSGEWIVKSEKIYGNPFILYYTYNNFLGQSFRTFFSQTLFSDDDKFEFYVPTGIQKNRTIKESDNNGDGIIDTRETSDSYLFSGINVVSEDGNVLATFTTEGFLFIENSSSTIKINRIGNIYYFIIPTNDDNNPYAVYKLEKTDSNTNNPSLSRKEGDLNNDGNVDVADHVELSKIIMNQK